MERKINRQVLRRSVLLLILSIHSALLAYSAYVHSPVVDEPGYMVAGLSHWKFGRFEIYRVNPPLIRMVATLPVLAAGYEEDWSGFYEGAGARPVFSMGEDFVAANGERSFWLFTLARWACIPFSWIGACVCYLWARDLYGKSAGLVSCALWCFSPTVLGHASLMATDAHAASLGVAACYLFWRWLQNPNWGRACAAAIALGVAQLAKTTLVLLYPLWPLLWLIYRWQNLKESCNSERLLEAGKLTCIICISLYVLNLGYGFEGSLQPLKDYQFVSKLFMGQPEAATLDNQQSSAFKSSNNRFANSLLGHLPVPFPKNYLMGIDIQQRDFEGYTFKSYLRGEFRDHGWWYYYLYAIAIKVPLGTWLVGLLIAFIRLKYGISILRVNDEIVLLASPLVIFEAASYKCGFSHHLHYVLVCFPFAFIWLSQINALLRLVPQTKILNFTKSQAFFLLSAIGLSWSMLSSLWIYPHCLSYFNESIGGPKEGPKHLLHSNIDWGQDLPYMQELLQKGLLKRPVFLAYYGRFDPAEVGCLMPNAWPEVQGTADIKALEDLEKNTGISLPTGRYAISVNVLWGLQKAAYNGAATKQVVLSDKILQYLRTLKPSQYLGYSMLVFDPKSTTRPTLQQESQPE